MAVRGPCRRLSHAHPEPLLAGRPHLTPLTGRPLLANAAASDARQSGQPGQPDGAPGTRPLAHAQLRRQPCRAGDEQRRSPTPDEQRWAGPRRSAAPRARSARYPESCRHEDEPSGAGEAEAAAHQETTECIYAVYERDACSGCVRMHVERVGSHQPDLGPQVARLIARGSSEVL